MAPLDLENRAWSDKRLFSRSTLYGLTLFVALIWGSAILVSSVSTAISLRNVPASIQLADSFAKVYPWHKFSKKKQFTIDTWRGGDFRPNFHSVQWIHNSDSAYNDQGTYLVKELDQNENLAYVVKSVLDESYTHVLFSGSSFKYHGLEYKIDALQASPDLTKAVIKTDSVHGWRHSSTALFWVLDVANKQITPLFNVDEKISFAKWSPTSDQIAFVLDNNVYVKDLVSGTISQITDDGSKNVFNGKPDWVYEEEVFADESVLWWSPEGDKLTFLKFNDASVPEFPIPYFAQDGYEQYPKVVSLKYPKPGFDNPEVDLIVVKVPKYSGSAFQMHKADLSSQKIKDKLIVEVLWVSNEKILIKTTNRASDIQEIFLILSDEKAAASIIRTNTAENSWFEVKSNLLYVPMNASLGRYTDGYIDIIRKDGFSHLAYFLPPESPHPFIFTSGQWEVIDNYLDLQKNLVYFTATRSSSVERHFYSVNLLDVFHQKELPEINNITSGTKWYSGSFSSGSRFLLLNDVGPDIPLQQIVDLHDNSVVKVLETNEQIKQRMGEYDLPTHNVSVVTLYPEDNNGKPIQANMIEILPPSFNPKKQYPVLFYVYGGPGSQLVTQTFGVDFSHVVAAELNAVVVTVDGRGTGFNNMNTEVGSDYMYCVRDKLGHFEPLDQIAAAKEWASRPYVDKKRISIWGWSYGGFLTLKTLENDKDHVFSYGVSVAPVTQWKLYDSIYTERYLRTPQDNPEGYKTASISNAENFKTVQRFLIMHGSGDDNVHFQNSLRLLDEFNLHSVENYDFMVFPDSDHSISYHNGNKVVFDRILDWTRRAFSEEFIEARPPVYV